MKNFCRLTIGRTRELIKRELGVSTASLTAPPDMNGNPEWPYYQLIFGNIRVEVYLTSADKFLYGSKLIALSVTHLNSSHGTTEYFYSDSLEFASEYTEMMLRQDQCEAMGIQEDNIFNRLKREANEAVWYHYRNIKLLDSAYC